MNFQKSLEVLKLFFEGFSHISDLVQNPQMIENFIFHVTYVFASSLLSFSDLDSGNKSTRQRKTNFFGLFLQDQRMWKKDRQMTSMTL